ncbi:MAG: HDOD domain-containing protein [Gammaproteobacteria bacterium]
MSNTQEYLIEVANLISLPDVYIAVKEVVDDPNSGMCELSEVVSYDPAISARLLKIANSSFYGQVAKVDTIKKAVMLLGVKTVHDTVLNITVSQAFHSISDVNYDVATFWHNSVMRAVVAVSCAKELNIPEPDRLFTLGLLSDLGHMIMSIKEPGLMRSVIQQHNKTQYPLHLFERSTFGFDSSELGADLLESWSIPDSIVTGIRYQNCPEIATEFRQEASIIYCAARLHPDEKEFPNVLDFEILRKLNMNHLDFNQIRSDAASLYDEALSLFPSSGLKQAV